MQLRVTMLPVSSDFGNINALPWVKPFQIVHYSNKMSAKSDETDKRNHK